MEIKNQQGVQRLAKATVYSFKGLKSAIVNETSFRQEILLCLILLPGAFWLGRTVEQRALLVLSCFLILIVELLNSAIETIVDRIGVEKNPLSGRAKDMGSAAVLLSLVAAGFVWVLIGWQRWTS
ncbi:MAG: diacylglycerol kinase [Desulfobacteraceae bacterium]|nr:diacylglycerol kinase [Desulfobacteraceae bacterium]